MSHTNASSDRFTQGLQGADNMCCSEKEFGIELRVDTDKSLNSFDFCMIACPSQARAIVEVDMATTLLELLQSCSLGYRWQRIFSGFYCFWLRHKRRIGQAADQSKLRLTVEDWPFEGRWALAWTFIQLHTIHRYEYAVFG